MIGFLFFVFLWQAPNWATQSDTITTISLSDTASYGGIDLYRLKGWRFSYTKPDAIRDTLNLDNFYEVDVLNGLKPIMESPDWKQYGWFEFAFFVDSSISEKPWWLAYFESAGAKVWLNGKLVASLGNPSELKSEEELPTVIPTDNPLRLRAGVNYLLVEYSNHTAPYIFHKNRMAQYRMAMILRKPYDTSLHRYRSLLLGAAIWVLAFLIVIYGFLSQKFKEQIYHRYILLTMFFFLIHAFTGLGDSLINWSFSFYPIQTIVYTLSFLLGLYFYLISIRLLFALKIYWKYVNSILVVSALAILYGLFWDFHNLFIVQFVIGLIAFGFGVYSIYEAKHSENADDIGFIQAGLWATMLGVLVYLAGVIIQYQYEKVTYLISVTLVYGGIPLSLTMHIIRNYAKLVKTLDLKVKERTAQLEKANAYQKLFFANISHEFRTPLTISKGLLVKVLQDYQHDESPNRNKLHTINRNIDRLKNMIDQIIDLSQSDEYRLVLHKQVFHADNLTRLLAESFRSLAESKKQEFKVNLNGDAAAIEVDRDRFEIIVNNLISNAIKFTQNEGKIEVTTNLEDGIYTIRVTDNGHGIPPEQQERIFERFHRIQQNNVHYVEGMGIGLELSRTLARAMNGDVRLDSAVRTGSSFMLLIPVCDSTYEEPEEYDVTELHEAKDVFENSEIEIVQQYSILLVEDNQDMQAYVSEILEEIGTVSIVSNGKEALKYIQQKRPDMVVTDLMMPEMDGQTLIETLRNDPKTRTLPIVVLSAKALQDDKLDVLRIGVVDYITKPFLAEELKLKVQNLLEFYETRRKVEIVIEDDSIQQQAGNLLEKAAQFVYEEINNVNFSPELLADKLAVSRRTLYRILEAETGTTPATFIKEIRLTRAQKLLQSDKKITLEQVANQVGYRNAKSFRKLYQDRFGIHPLDDRNKS
ncbi:response regulator [bacterium]|nr:MAG: response regulator [bacterium]